MPQHVVYQPLAKQVPGTLTMVLGVAAADVEVVRAGHAASADMLIKTPGHTYVVELKQASSAAAIAFAAKQVRERTRQMHPPAIPLVAVPFMGDVGRRVCAEAGVGWFDLSGNAHIVARGLYIHVEGRPNRFKSAGRPANVFAPKSARVARWLLIHADEYCTQREIARATGMDEGHVSRIVARLEQEGFLVRGERSAVRPRDPALLLEAWRERYQFSKHHILQGHVAARSGEALLRMIAEVFANEQVEHAVTGLAAAWAFTHFAGFQLVTIYLAEGPAPAAMQRLGFREEPRGANLWLAVPNDAGVFQGATLEEGIRCVHPVQVYLDLKEQPERAAEAAERLRAERLTWSRHA